MEQGHMTNTNDFKILEVDSQSVRRNKLSTGDILLILTKKDGGNPYLKMLSAKTRTAQKCIHELKTCGMDI